MRELTDGNFQDILKIKDGKPIFIKFSAVWCGPCKRMAPHFEKLSKEVDAHFFTVDVDNSTELSSYFKATSLPTIISIVGGEIVNKYEGSDMEEITKLVKKYT